MSSCVHIEDANGEMSSAIALRHVRIARRPWSAIVIECEIDQEFPVRSGRLCIRSDVASGCPRTFGNDVDLLSLPLRCKHRS